MKSSAIELENPGGAQILKLATRPFLFRMFLFRSLPLAGFANLKINELNPEKAVCSVPFTWMTKNPFRSVYFAALTMAAEMSTGILANYHIAGRKPSVSMLVHGVEGNFTKKSTERIYFTCENGEDIARAVKETMETGEGVLVKAESVGRTKDGTEVARLIYTWSFKRRSSK